MRVKNIQDTPISNSLTTLILSNQSPNYIRIFVLQFGFWPLACDSSHPIKKILTLNLKLIIDRIVFSYSGNFRLYTINKRFKM